MLLVPVPRTLHAAADTHPYKPFSSNNSLRQRKAGEVRGGRLQSCNAMRLSYLPPLPFQPCRAGCKHVLMLPHAALALAAGTPAATTPNAAWISVGAGRWPSWCWPS